MYEMSVALRALSHAELVSLLEYLALHQYTLDHQSFTAWKLWRR